MRWCTLILLVVVALAGCTPSDGGLPGAVSHLGDPMPPPDKVAVGGDAGATDYRVQPLDVLDISVFQVPDLTKTVEVSSSGQISLPLIGAVAVAGKSVSGVEAEIAAKLRANYLQAPQVSVFVKESANSRVTVDGAVKNPGVYPVKGQITLLQALATAGGIDLSVADRQGIIVLRKIGGRVQAAKFDYFESLWKCNSNW